MKRLLVWGNGTYYDRYIYNILRYEQLLENVKIVAFTAKDISVSLISYKDNIPLMKKEDALALEFDYIIVGSDKFAEEIIDELIVKWKVSEDNIINGRVFKQPLFDFNRYCEVYKKKISIFTESCYGGHIYHSLGMKFNSPLINMRIGQYDYLKFLSDPVKYLQSDCICTKKLVDDLNDLNFTVDKNNINWGYAGYPQFKLDDIIIHAVHSDNVQRFLDEWKRRVERINFNNMIFFMIIENDEIAERFSQIKGIRKKGFYFKETSCEDIINLNEYNPYKDYKFSFRSYVHSIFQGGGESKIPLDILKLLNDEKDFVRIKKLQN